MKKILLTGLACLFGLSVAHAAVDLFDNGNRVGRVEKLNVTGSTVTKTGNMGNITAGATGVTSTVADGILLDPDRDGTNEVIIETDGTIGTSGTARIDNQNNATEYLDFNDFPGDNMTTISPGLEIKEANTLFPPDDIDIETFIGNASSGDIIYLSPNTTYATTDDIDISKSITIDGQGATIACTGNAKNVFDITADNVTIKNLTITSSGTGSSSAIQIDGRGGAVLSNVNIENVDITMGPSNGSKVFISARDGGGTVRNCTITGESSDSSAIAGRLINSATAEAATNIYYYNTRVHVTSGGGTGAGFTCQDSSATQDANVFVYDSEVTVVEGAASSSYGVRADTGSNAKITVDGCVLNAPDTDISSANSATVVVKNTVSANNTIGAATITGGLVTGNLVLKEITAPSTAGADQGYFFLDTSDNNLYFQFDSGAAVLVGTHP